MASLSDSDRSVGFLIHDIARLMRRNLDRRLQSLGLTQAQWRAIAHLSRDPGLRQAALAERLEVKPITLGRLIDRMEAAGWVERSDDPDDRRASRLHLTRKSLPIIEEMQDHAAETMEEAFAGLSSPVRRQLISALERMKRNLFAAESAAVAAVRTRQETHAHGGRKHRASAGAGR
jgi:MarR family transcriptional regulator for hemolysin